VKIAPATVCNELGGRVHTVAYMQYFPITHLDYVLDRYVRSVK
jgi:hypothetical protein